jgi:hypothetical protein
MAKSVKHTNKLRAKFLQYWDDHPNYTAFVHVTLGIGLGVLAQTYVGDGYVNALGWTLVLVGVIGHLYPLVG